MPSTRLPLRLILLAAAAIGAALFLGLVVATLNSLLEFYQRMLQLPIWLRVPLIVAAGVIITWREHRMARAIPPVSALEED